MAQLFGFEIKRASKEKGEQLPSFVLPDMDDAQLPLLDSTANI